MLLHRLAATTAFCAAIVASAHVAAAPPQEPDAGILEGIRQVGQGDYEGAVATLQEAIQRLLTGDPAPGELARGYLYLGIAHAALDDPAASRAAFRHALDENPDLRVTTEHFSPKVVRLFEEARAEGGGASAETGGGGARTGILVALGAGAAAGVAIAAGGGDEAGGGTARFQNARFATPLLECPDGSAGTPIPFVILIDAANDSGASVSISSHTVTITIVDSPIPGEIGISGPQPSAISPSVVPAGSQRLIQVDASITCINDPGNEPRYNTWQGLVSLATSAGAFNLETSNTMRVEVP